MAAHGYSRRKNMSKVFGEGRVGTDTAMVHFLRCFVEVEGETG